MRSFHLPGGKTAWLTAVTGVELNLRTGAGTPDVDTDGFVGQVQGGMTATGYANEGNVCRRRP